MITRSHKRPAATAGEPKAGPAETSRASEGDPAEIHYVHHPSFSLPATAERLWGEGREEIDVAPYSLLPELDEDRAAGGRGRTSLSRQQERTLFLRYNYAKYRLKKLTEKPATAKRRQEAAGWRARARKVREKILHANLPLVPAMAKRKRVDGVEFAEKVAEGYLAILRSVEYFDASRGFKFSTYACRAILAALCRLGSKAQTYRKHVPVQFEPAFEQDDYADRRHRRQRRDAIESMRQVLQRNEAKLSEVQAEVIRQRYPVAGQGEPQPLWKVGRELGVSTERVRQIERVSLKKLGEALNGVLTA
jgi:RNA polymerase sigma factor (sigma-70 family)